MNDLKDDKPQVITAGSGKIVQLPCSAVVPETGQYVLEWKKESATVYTFMNGEEQGHAMIGYAGT